MLSAAYRSQMKYKQEISPIDLCSSMKRVHRRSFAADLSIRRRRLFHHWFPTVWLRDDEECQFTCPMKKESKLFFMSHIFLSFLSLSADIHPSDIIDANDEHTPVILFSRSSVSRLTERESWISVDEIYLLLHMTPSAVSAEALSTVIKQRQKIWELQVCL